jgi:predicted nucleotidyltransferase
MNNPFGLPENDMETIISILRQHQEVEEASIFGSRAKGNYKNGSDVDIALKGKKLNFKTISHISYLLNEETHIPYKFDVLNYHTISNNDLIEHIDRVGIIFYNQNQSLTPVPQQ